MSHLTPEDSMARPASLPVRTQSWPGKASKVPGWRRGRTEVMEDALEEMGHAPVDDFGNALAARMRTLDLGQAASTDGENMPPERDAAPGQDRNRGKLLSELIENGVGADSGTPTP